MQRDLVCHMELRRVIAHSILPYRVFDWATRTDIWPTCASLAAYSCSVFRTRPRAYPLLRRKRAPHSADLDEPVTGDLRLVVVRKASLSPINGLSRKSAILPVFNRKEKRWAQLWMKEVGPFMARL